MKSSAVASINEIAPDTYRVSVALPDALPGGFSFNQYLVVDEMPLIFHTGPKKLFPLIREQIESVLPLSKLRYIAFSHFEADECGSLPEFLLAAPESRPVCSEVAALVSVRDIVDVEPLGMADGQMLDLGRHKLMWQSAPHVPHGWDCGYFFDTTTETLFCGDLFTQPGLGERPIVEDDILGPSEAFRRPMDYYSHAPETGRIIDRLASLAPRRLACMHGSAWRGDGAAMLRSLGASLAQR
jgi:flavorubredoxin